MRIMYSIKFFTSIKETNIYINFINIEISNFSFRVYIRVSFKYINKLKLGQKYTH